MCIIQFLGIKIADSASVMKHRPLFSIIQFACQQAFYRFKVVFGFYQVSTNFFIVGFLPSFYQNSSKYMNFQNSAVTLFLSFLPSKSPVESKFLCDSV